MSLGMLKTARKYIRVQITKHFNSRSNIDNFTSNDKQKLKLKLENFTKDLISYDSQIQGLLWDDQKSENDNENCLFDELSKCEEYKDKIDELISMLGNVIPSSTSNRDIDAARSVLKSPTAPLPVFKSLEGEDIERFLREFEDTCSQFKYTERDKFLLLRPQVSGRASMLLDSLEIDRQSFSVGKNLLKEALASSELQKFNVLTK